MLRRLVSAQILPFRTVGFFLAVNLNTPKKFGVRYFSNNRRSWRSAMKQDWHPDELAQHWTLSAEERELLDSKTSATRLSFARYKAATQPSMRPRCLTHHRRRIRKLAACEPNNSTRLWDELPAPPNAGTAPRPRPCRNAQPGARQLRRILPRLTRGAGRRERSARVARNHPRPASP
jgi:hypothetical protein